MKPPAETPSWRLFIALPLAPAGQSALLSLQQNLQNSLQNSLLQTQAASAQLRWLPPAQLHLTLHFLGETPTTQLPELQTLILTTAAQTPALDLRLTQLTWFPKPRRPRVLVALTTCPPALTQLQQQLSQQLQQLGFCLPTHNDPRMIPWPFQPHLSLARLKLPRTPSSVKLALPALPTLPPDIKLSIQQLQLLRSQLQPQGAHYTPLTTASLQPS